MSNVLNKIMGFGGSPKREYHPRVKTTGKTIDQLKELAASKGLELYVDETTKCYWIWKDGSCLEGQSDPFDTLPQVKAFLKSYAA
jgi:hypothetical protein